MTRIFLVMGVPGSGKSTLLRMILNHLPPSTAPYRCGWISGTWHEHVLVLGKYEEGDALFPGTDRWSKGIQYHVPQFWQDTTLYGKTILGEGDRISTHPFIDAARAHAKVILLFLVADHRVLQKRRENRSQQNPQWVRGMYSRMKNLSEHYAGILPIYWLSNETPEELADNCKLLLTLINTKEELCVT